MTVSRLHLSVAVLVCFAALGAVAAPAAAHAAYKDSDPQDGSTVSTPPSAVWAEFTEPLAQGSYLRVFDPCGTQVDHGDTTLSGYRMTVSMSGETSGRYVVEFMAISAVDGHHTTGDFDFTSTSGPACASDDGSAEPVAEPEPEPGDDPPGGSDDEAGSEPGAAGDDGAPGQGVGAGGRSGADERRERERERTDRKDEGVTGESGDLVGAAASQPDDAVDNVWDGIPLGPFFVALAIAAAIGAAGGRIYAGILGPRA